MVLFSLFACLLPSADDTACIVMVTPSVRVHVVDEAGEMVDATVTATDADGNPLFVECADDAPPCSEWLVGEDDSGHLTMVATTDDGCTGTLEVDVLREGGACDRVVTEDTTLPVACGG